jgi:hypothetical protein
MHERRESLPARTRACPSSGQFKDARENLEIAVPLKARRHVKAERLCGLEINE